MSVGLCMYAYSAAPAYLRVGQRVSRHLVSSYTVSFHLSAPETTSLKLTMSRGQIRGNAQCEPLSNIMFNQELQSSWLSVFHFHFVS